MSDDTHEPPGRGEQTDPRWDHNRETLEYRADKALLAVRALVVAGLAGAVSWVWLTARQQITASRFIGFGADDAGLSLLERVDLLSQYMTLLIYSALAIAVGSLGRVLLCDIVHRAGGVLERPRPRRSVTERGWGAYE